MIPKSPRVVADGFYWYRRYTANASQPWEVVMVKEKLVFSFPGTTGERALPITLTDSQRVGHLGGCIRRPQRVLNS